MAERRKPATPAQILAIMVDANTDEANAELRRVQARLKGVVGYEGRK